MNSQSKSDFSDLGLAKPNKEVLKVIGGISYFES